MTDRDSNVGSGLVGPSLESINDERLNSGEYTGEGAMEDDLDDKGLRSGENAGDMGAMEDDLDDKGRCFGEDTGEGAMEDDLDDKGPDAPEPELKHRFKGTWENITDEGLVTAPGDEGGSKFIRSQF
jgi:hypothetical protein